MNEGVTRGNGSGRRSQELAPIEALASRAPTGWRIADAVLAVVLFTAVVVAGSLDKMPRGLDGFFAIRLTIKNALLIAAFAWAWPYVMKLCGLYNLNRLRTGDGEWPRLALAGVVGAVLAMAFPLTSQSGVVVPMHALLFGAAIIPAARILRSSRRALGRLRHPARERRIVLVGSGPLAARLYRRLVSDPFHYITVVGFVDSEPQAALAGMGSVHLGGVQDLERLLMHRVVDDVCIGLPVKSRYEEIQESLAACARVGVPASYSADLFTGCYARPSPANAPILSLTAMPRTDLLAVKRAIDVVGSLILAVVLAPVMVGVALAIKLTSKGPVLFVQERYGYMKRRFRMYKFRTMVDGAELLQEKLEDSNEASGPVFKIRNDPRFTPIGSFLRRYSLDELPQIWHVLTGEMSLVGPRPMATRDVKLFPEPCLMRRFSVRPGLTCLWQISGRSNIGFDQWMAFDLQYIDNWSLWSDLKILIRTPPALVRGTGAM